MLVFLLKTSIIATSLVLGHDILKKVTYDKFITSLECLYHEPDEDKIIADKGQMIVNKNKYHIKTGNFDIICNGKKLWNYNRKKNEVNVINDAENEDNPLFLIMNYNKSFEIKDCIKEKGLYKITMIKKNDIDENYDIKYFEIICDKKFIKQLNIYNEDNSWTTIIFKTWDITSKIKNNIFEFDNKKHKAKIIEL